MTGLILFAHGSTVESANEAVRHIGAQLAKQGGYDRVATSFLEGGTPDLPAAAETLIAGGADRIVVLPYFLTLGLHLKRDLPRLVEQVQAAHPGVEFETAPPLDGHDALVTILLDRARTALAEHPRTIALR